ncbi:MAG: ribosome maturation factor RimM [Nocardioidaceae bacterium]
MAVPETIVVGRIGKPHGVKGEVSVEPRTDEPDRRFADGVELKTQSKRPENADRAPVPSTLTVAGTRWHSGRLLVRFAEIADRNAAEEARGTLLSIDLDPDERPEDPEEFYDHQLVGLTVVTTDGRSVGTLKEIVHGTAQDLLVIAAEGPDVLVPFVSQLVPEVDVPGGRIVVADVPGLLSDLD